MLDQIITTSVGLALLAGGYLLWLLTGIVNAAINTKTWSWKKTLTDLSKALLMGAVVLGLVALSNGLEWYADMLGFDVSAFTDGLSTVTMVGGITAGIATYYGRAMRNALKFFNLRDDVKLIDGATPDYAGIAEAAKKTAREIAELITPKHTVNETQTNIEAEFEAKEAEVGQGAGENPLSRRLPDGDNDGGKGWQCSKYSWFLATGIRMNYPPHPDYGPCNGDAMADYLINKLGWVRCGKINGAIFAYAGGAYGHTGMVVDAANNIISDANWTPLTISTHYLNLDAVGAVYCCPLAMLEAPKPAPAMEESAQPAENPENAAETPGIIATPAAENPENPAENPKKPFAKFRALPKKQKIAILAAGWVFLLGLGAAAALLTKPAPEIVRTDAIIEAYKFAESSRAEIIDTVDDLDYYGTYAPNPLEFTKITEGRAKGAYLISGLKNKSVEDKINARIQSVASTVYNSSYDSVNMRVTANYFNLLSLELGQWAEAGEDYRKEFLTFDLNTGDELTFDQLFSANVNLPPLLFKSFYDSLSTNLQFGRLAASKRLKEAEASVCSMYCPYPGETVASLRALLADYDAQMANMEQTAANAVQEYLSGAKKFYLNAYGPAFILSDGQVVEMELKDDLRYAVYLKNFRSSDSIFANAAPASNPFFTENPAALTNFINEESDSYLFDYAEDAEGAPEFRRALRDYVKEKGLSFAGDSAKFRHILASGNIGEWGKLRIGYFDVCASETDKSYYESTYKKAIIDGKNQSVMMSGQQPARSGHFDPEKVRILNADSCFQQNNVAITASGKIIDNVDGVLVNPASGMGWEEYLKAYAYDQTCRSSWNPVCYSADEKRAHELFYVFEGSHISVRRKVDSESGWESLAYIDIDNLPAEYLNPEILVK